MRLKGLGADVVATDPEAIAKSRNVLDPVAWRGAGWTYLGLGRP